MGTEMTAWRAFLGRICGGFFCLFLAGAACSSGDPADRLREDRFPIPEDAQRVEVTGRYGGVLRYPLVGEPSTFNYLAARELRGRRLGYLTTGTLLEFDAGHQQVVSGLAKEWSVSPDGRSVRLQLREGIRFSDGEPMDASDVVFTFEKIYEEGSRNVLRDSLMFEGEPLQVAREGDFLVTVTFPRPYAAAEYILSTVPVFPAHRFVEAGKKVEEYWGLGTPPEEMAGLGPFVLEEHQPGQRSRFRYNPHYWKVDQQGRRLPYLDGFVAEYIEDRDSQLLRFQSSQLDLLDEMRPEDFELLQEAGQGIEVQNVGPSSNLSFYWFNLNLQPNPETGKPYLAAEKRDWFSRREFRQGVSAAISRQAIVRNVYFGQATPAFSIVPPSIEGWYSQDLPRHDGDLDRARSLLRSAGFQWQREGAREILVDSRGRRVAFELLTRSEDVMGKMAAMIQQDLGQLGMEVAIRQEEFRAAISRIMGSRDYDSALMNLDFPIEPADYLNVLLSNRSMHIWSPLQGRPASPWEARIDELMMEQIRTLDLERRREMFRQVQQILAEQQPLIPLVNRDVLVAHRSSLRGLDPANVFPYALWNVWELWFEDRP